MAEATQSAGNDPQGQGRRERREAIENQAGPQTQAAKQARVEYVRR